MQFFSDASLNAFMPVVFIAFAILYGLPIALFIAYFYRRDCIYKGKQIPKYLWLKAALAAFVIGPAIWTLMAIYSSTKQ